jgi:hypothetical protein
MNLRVVKSLASPLGFYVQIRCHGLSTDIIMNVIYAYGASPGLHNSFRLLAATYNSDTFKIVAKLLSLHLNVHSPAGFRICENIVC